MNAEKAQIHGVQAHGPHLDEDTGFWDTRRGAVMGEAEARGLVVGWGCEAADDFDGGHGGLRKTGAREISGVAAEGGAETLGD